jgi:hypothetical protein
MSDSTKPTTALMTHDEQKAVYEAQDVLASKSNVLMRIGQIQAFNIVSKYTTVVEILTFREIKKSKQYKGLPYIKDGKTLTCQRLEEFCPAFFNRSYQTMDELDKNLEVFGQEFFESSEKMGLGVREMRKLRKLPEEQRALVIDHEAIEKGDKDTIKHVIEDLHAQFNQQKDDLLVSHDKQLKELQTKLADMSANLEAARQINTESSTRYESLRSQLEREKQAAEKSSSTTRDLLSDIAEVSNDAFDAFFQMHNLMDKVEEAAFNYDSTLVAERDRVIKFYIESLDKLACNFASLLMAADENFFRIIGPTPKHTVIKGLAERGDEDLDEHLNDVANILDHQE